MSLVGDILGLIVVVVDDGASVPSRVVAVDAVEVLGIGLVLRLALVVVVSNGVVGDGASCPPYRVVAVDAVVVLGLGLVILFALVSVVVDDGAVVVP